MTNYDILVDTLVMHLYDMRVQENWDETQAKRKAHEILTTVEAFQQKRSTLTL